MTEETFLLFRRRSARDLWEQAPIECQTTCQEPGWEYRYFFSDCARQAPAPVEVSELVKEAKRYGRRKWYDLMDERIDRLASMASTPANGREPTDDQFREAIGAYLRHPGDELASWRAAWAVLAVNATPATEGEAVLEYSAEDVVKAESDGFMKGYAAAEKRAAPLEAEAQKRSRAIVNYGTGDDPKWAPEAEAQKASDDRYGRCSQCGIVKTMTIPGNCVRQACPLKKAEAQKAVAPKLPDVSELLVWAVTDELFGMSKIMDADLQDALVKYSKRILALAPTSSASTEAVKK